MRLSSTSFLEGFYYKPRIDKEILERHSEGLICLSGCASAEFSDHILHGKTAEAEKLCAWYQKVFGEENFFVEIQNNGVADPARLRRAARSTSRGGWACRWSATSDAHYLTQDDAPAHDVLLCINTGKTLDDPNRMKFETDQFYVRSPEEMYAAMPGHDEALATLGADRRAGRGQLHEPRPRQAPVPVVPAARARRPPRPTSRELCEAGPERALRRAPAAGGPRPARARAGHHQPDGLRLATS